MRSGLFLPRRAVDRKRIYLPGIPGGFPLDTPKGMPKLRPQNKSVGKILFAVSRAQQELSLFIVL